MKVYIVRGNGEALDSWMTEAAAKNSLGRHLHRRGVHNFQRISRTRWSDGQTTLWIQLWTVTTESGEEPRLLPVAGQMFLFEACSDPNCDPDCPGWHLTLVEHPRSPAPVTAPSCGIA